MHIEASSTAKNTFNPIRSIVDKMKVEPNPAKKMIYLSLGDPTVFGNLETAGEVREAMRKVIEDDKADGYGPSVGTEAARQAIAKRYKTRFAVDFTSADITITSGCSGALDLAISVLCGPDDILLIPRPGFTLYGTLAGSKGIRISEYQLDAARNWEIDLEEVEEILKGDEGKKVRAWLINNPSNPCGSVYSKEHLEACLKLAKKYEIPVIADEIYEDMVFSGSEYVPLARLSQNDVELRVPVLTCSGLAKRFLVPGWRFGWVALYEPLGIDMPQIRKGLFDLSTLIIGSCTLIQAALPEIFEKTPESFYKHVDSLLETNSKYLTEELSKIPGLKVIRPQGTLYMLVGIDFEIHDKLVKDNVQICEKLIAEQSIHVLPGSIFGMDGYFRIVYSAPIEILKEFIERIREFFNRK